MKGPRLAAFGLEAEDVLPVDFLANHPDGFLQRAPGQESVGAAAGRPGEAAAAVSDALSWLTAKGNLAEIARVRTLLGPPASR